MTARDPGMLTDEEVAERDRRLAKRAANRFHIPHRWEYRHCTGSYDCTHCWASVSHPNLQDWPHPFLGDVTVDEIWNLLKHGYASVRISTPNPENVAPHEWMIEVV